MTELYLKPTSHHFLKLLLSMGFLKMGTADFLDLLSLIYTDNVLLTRGGLHSSWGQLAFCTRHLIITLHKLINKWWLSTYFLWTVLSAGRNTVRQNNHKWSSREERHKKDKDQLSCKYWDVCTYVNGWHFKRNKRFIQPKNVVKAHIRNNHRTTLDYREFCKQWQRKGTRNQEKGDQQDSQSQRNPVTLNKFIL